MMKYALYLGVFLVSISAQAMQKRIKKISHKDKTTKIEPATKEERIAYGRAFIGNIDKVLYKNGFAIVEKDVLTEIRKNLNGANLADDQEFKAFFKYAQYGTLALKGKATEQTFNEQIFYLGRLCLMAAECNVHNIDKRNNQGIKTSVPLLIDAHTTKDQQNLSNGKQVMPPLLEDSVE